MSDQPKAFTSAQLLEGAAQLLEEQNRPGFASEVRIAAAEIERLSAEVSSLKKERDYYRACYDDLLARRRGDSGE